MNAYELHLHSCAIFDTNNIDITTVEYKLLGNHLFSERVSRNACLSQNKFSVPFIYFSQIY